MYPYLKNKVIIVNGPSADGVYDLNRGLFFRINTEAGSFLDSLNGNHSYDEFDALQQTFIDRAKENGLVEFSQTAIRVHQKTHLNDVIQQIRPVRFAWIELTSKCNQLCQHCFLGEDLNRFPHVDKYRIFEFLETLYGAGARQIILSGGEPTVHPDFGEILDKAATYPFRLSLLTNGSSRKLKNYIPQLVQHGVTVKIPILGWEDSHNDMAGAKGVFQRTIQSIETLIAANVQVELGTTVTGINYKDIHKIRAYADKLSLKLEVSPVYAVGYARTNASRIQAIPQQDIIEICRNDKQKTEQSSAGPNIQNMTIRPQFDMDPTDYDAVNLKDYLTEHHECGQKIIAILSSGEVTPCLMLRDRKFSLGSTTEYTLAEILLRKSNIAQQFDNMMSLKNISGCSECEARFVCKAGGCPASAYAFAGSIQEKNPLFTQCYYLNEQTRAEVGLAGLT